MRVFIFKLNSKTHYIVPIFYSNLSYEQQAWKDISQRLSCREEIARKRLTLVKEISEWNPKIVKL